MLASHINVLHQLDKEERGKKFIVGYLDLALRTSPILTQINLHMQKAINEILFKTEVK
jgi:hypothetical protein